MTDHIAPDNRYGVEAILNPDQPSLFYLLFEELDEARGFYETLKRSMTAHRITVMLNDPKGETIEMVELGDELRPARKVEKVAYDQIIEPLDHSTMTTGDPNNLLID